MQQGIATVMTRFSLWPLLMLLGFCCSLPVQAQFVPGIDRTATEQLADGLYAFRWGPYRSIFIVTDEGVIATDPINREAAKLYRQAIATVTDQPVKYLVYSHAHWDHAAGGEIFKREGAQIVAQQRCVDNIKTSPHPDVLLPDITFDREYSVKLGGRSLDLYYFGPSHGTCLVAMVPRPAPMLFLVDVVTPPGGWYMPWDPQVADFQFANILSFFEQLETMVAEQQLQQVIASHLVPRAKAGGGVEASPTVGDISAVAERHRFWRQLMMAVKAEMDAGTESFLVHARIDTTPFESARGYDRRKFRELVKRVASYYAIGR